MRLPDLKTCAGYLAVIAALALSLPGPVLKPGDFEIQLEGWRDEWPADHAYDPVDTLTFRVQASR